MKQALLLLGIFLFSIAFFTPMHGVSAQSCIVRDTTGNETNGTCVDSAGDCSSGNSKPHQERCGDDRVCCANATTSCSSQGSGASCQMTTSCSGTILGQFDCPSGQMCCQSSSSGSTDSTGTTCSGGSCQSTCSSGSFSDSACSSSCSSSGGGSYCRSCSGTSHSCVASSEACPSGSTDLSSSCASACTDSTKPKYCVSSSSLGTTGSGSGAVKCDPAKFKEYAGVCFPLNTGLSETPVATIVMNLMKWMLYLFGFLAIIAFVVSGIQYLAASGNMNMIETAKRNMKFSILGVIVALAGLVIIIAIDALLKGTAWGG